MHFGRLLLTGEDLAHIRVAKAANPLDEMQRAAHRLARGHIIDALAAGWARRTAFALGPTGAMVMDVIGSPVINWSDLGLTGDRRFAIGFDEVADAIRSVPSSGWAREAADLADFGIPPGRPAVMADDPSRIAEFATVIERFMNIALGPHWPAIEATTAAHSDAVARRLAFEGAGAVLNSLHPAITWDDPILTFGINRGAFCAPDCPHWLIYDWSDREEDFETPLELYGSELLLVPSALATGLVLCGPGGPEGAHRPFQLIYPVPWDWSMSGDAHHQALADLVGATRATVLDALLGRTLTTSELARLVHVSPASASEHATVLRTAGLLSSSREGPRVYHRLTSMGIGLATGGRGVTFTGTVADRINS